MPMFFLIRMCFLSSKNTYVHALQGVRKAIRADREKCGVLLISGILVKFNSKGPRFIFLISKQVNVTSKQISDLPLCVLTSEVNGHALVSNIYQVGHLH